MPLKSTIREDKTPSEVLMDSMVDVEKASGVIVIIDSKEEGYYVLRSNLCPIETTGLMEIAKHHVIRRIQDE